MWTRLTPGRLTGTGPDRLPGVKLSTGAISGRYTGCFLLRNVGTRSLSVMISVMVKIFGSKDFTFPYIIPLLTILGVGIKTYVLCQTFAM